MAVSTYPTTQYPSEQFVESSGAILFNLTKTDSNSDSDPPSPQVCLIHYLPKNEWMLAKGRRNCHESRRDAALREVEEETGYKCRLHPVTMDTRAPGIHEANDVSDQARRYPGLTEPFMLTVREMGDGGVKLIWWFVAVVDGIPGDGDGNGSVPVGAGESDFRAEFFTFKEALRRLSFRNDRDVLERAIALVQDS